MGSAHTENDMPSDMAKPEDIIENSPNKRGEKGDGERNAGEKRNLSEPLPGEDENNPDDRTDSNDR
jgi:hypothetical protein